MHRRIYVKYKYVLNIYFYIYIYILLNYSHLAYIF